MNPDQCVYCTLSGNSEACKSNECLIRSSSYVKELERQIKLYEENIEYLLETTPNAVKAAGQGSKADDLVIGLAITVLKLAKKE